MDPWGWMKLVMTNEIIHVSIDVFRFELDRFPTTMAQGL